MEHYPIIHRYTRLQAIEDGFLVDLSEWASAEHGFRGGFQCPVAVTRSVWNDIESIPPSKRGWQDIRGRSHDVLFMASLAARRGKRESLFEVILHVGRRSRQTYKLVLGCGDEGQLVATIMRPEEG